MKKMKKILALIMAMAMVLGMGITTLAEGTTSEIEINNAGDGKFAAVQVIEADSTKDTGWDFVDGYAQHFTNAFNTTDTQAIIKGMIYAQNSSASEGVAIEDFDVKYAAALNNVYATISDDAATNVSPLTVDKAGVWVIKGVETNFSYSPMAAYVGFSYESGKPSGLLDAAEINAKKAPMTIEKSSDDADKIVEIEQEVTYTVSSTVPFVPATDSNRYYKFIDEITGAEYSDIDSSLTVAVTIGSNPPIYNHEYQAIVSDMTNDEGEKIGETFTLDLTELLGSGDTANQYANQPITLTYMAVVKELTVHNTVFAGDGTTAGKDKYGSDDDRLISGTVTLTKLNESGEKLGGAGFVVLKETPENDTTITKYAIFDAENKLTGWTTVENEATTVYTDDTGDSITNPDYGTLTVNGLDKGIEYKFKEVEAPDGYSINETNVTVTWNEADTELETPVTGSTSMVDTELSSLPSTGGIGTTIFTVGGCLIMIAAAALYFMNRRRDEE